MASCFGKTNMHFEKARVTTQALSYDWSKQQVAAFCRICLFLVTKPFNFFFCFFSHNFCQFFFSKMSYLRPGNYYPVQARFGHESSHSNEENASTPLITKLDKYSMEELKEYRQVFNMFDTGKFSCCKNRENVINFRQKWSNWIRRIRKCHC